MSCPKTLLKAVNAGRTRQVRLLLDLGASIEEQDECGQTPLIKSVLLEHDRNRDKILKFLLKRGARVSPVDVVGRNALMWASLNGRNNDVALLLEYADIDLDYNKADINGQTALFHAVTSGNAATVKLIVSVLMKYGLSTDTQDFNGTSPLMQAQRLGYDVCESILVFEGNAKVRISGNFVNISRREKWAISSLRDRAKVKIDKARRVKPSQFPPITNKITRREVSTDRGRRYDSDDEEADSGDENVPITPTGSNKENLADVLLTNMPALKLVQNASTRKRPQTEAILSSGSTELPSSGEESEVDSVASTVIETGNRKSSVRPVVDLTTMYSLKQEQMASSFRQTAVQIEEQERDSTPEVSKLKGKNVEVQKWKQLKRCLRLTGLRNVKASLPDTPEQQTTRGKSNAETPRKLSTLPSIFATEKKVNHKEDSVDSKEDNDTNRSYSEI